MGETGRETEADVERSEGQQDTGNHKRPGAPEQGGADAHGGTRDGAESVEPPNTRPRTG